jgi:hypothetical protein
MFEEYLAAGMKLAHYELLAENQGYYASIPNALRFQNIRA